MIKVRHAAFDSIESFESILGDAQIIWLHIYDGDPESKVLELFKNNSELDELLLLLDVRKDKGYLASTQYTTEITPPPREFISVPLIELRGFGGWTKGILFHFESDPTKYADNVKQTRKYSYGPNYMD